MVRNTIHNPEIPSFVSDSISDNVITNALSIYLLFRTEVVTPCRFKTLDILSYKMLVILNVTFS